MCDVFGLKIFMKPTGKLFRLFGELEERIKKQ